MWSYFKMELSKFFTNRKNISIYVLLTCFALFYAIRLAPAYDPIEKVDLHQMEAKYLDREEFLISREGKDPYSAHPAVQYAVGVFKPWNTIELTRMEALQKKDLKAYAIATSNWYKFTDAQTYKGGFYFYNPRYYTFGNADAHEEGHLAYLSTAARYEAYSKLDSDITLEVLEEFTAIQTFYRLMDDFLPYVFFVGCLLLSVDIVLQDRKYPTLLRGYPIVDWKKLIVKALTAFVGSLCLIVPLLVGYIIIGIQFGFGSLDFPVPIKSGYGFETITMASYFAKTGSLILCWFALIISFVILLSVTLRNEVANLIAGLIIIFSEYMYLDRGIGYLKPVENYPPTYTQVSQIITNMKNYFYTTIQIEYSKGLFLLIGCAAIFFALALVVSLSKRYRFIK
jgi:ABC-2 type transport system permease protein